MCLCIVIGSKFHSDELTHAAKIQNTYKLRCKGKTQQNKKITDTIFIVVDHAWYA